MSGIIPVETWDEHRDSLRSRFLRAVSRSETNIYVFLSYATTSGRPNTRGDVYFAVRISLQNKTDFSITHSTSALRAFLHEYILPVWRVQCLSFFLSREVAIILYRQTNYRFAYSQEIVSWRWRRLRRTSRAPCSRCLGLGTDTVKADIL